MSYFNCIEKRELTEAQIMTLLPASEEAFEKSKPSIAPSLEQAFRPSAVNYVSPIAAGILITCLLGRNLTHLHRPTLNDNEDDLNGEFWQRHRQLESLLSTISLGLPDHLRIPAGLPDSNVIFMNLLLQTSVICLHQAAIFKAERNRLPQTVINESRQRTVSAAAEITRMMKSVSHLDLSAVSSDSTCYGANVVANWKQLNPFTAFCLYVAARVFSQYLKWYPKDANMKSSLQFLGSAMHALKRRNPLTESFIAQLEVDLEGTGIDLGPGLSSSKKSSVRTDPAFPGRHHRMGILVDLDSDANVRPQAPSEIPVNSDAVKCVPLMEIRDSQQQGTSDPSIFKNRDFVSRAVDGASGGFEAPRSRMDVDSESPFNRASPQEHVQFSLPTRDKTPQFNHRTESASNLSSEDTSKSRSNSVKDSSSHSSFTPPSSTDDRGVQYHSNLSKHSPVTLDGSSGISTPGVGNAPDPMMFNMQDPNFANFNSPFFSAAFPGSGNINMSGWSMGGIENGIDQTTTGLTPMPDASFDFLNTPEWAAMANNPMFGGSNGDQSSS
jgi:hypothetical protein